MKEQVVEMMARISFTGMRIDELAFEREYCNCTSRDTGRKYKVSTLEVGSRSAAKHRVTRLC